MTRRLVPVRPWTSTDRTGGPLDEVFDRLRALHADLIVERLAMPHLADDDNVYFLGDASGRDRVQIDTRQDGRPPFWIEGDRGEEADNPSEAVRIAGAMLGEVPVRAVPKSPMIRSISWGHMEVEGLAPGKDFKLYPGGGRPWDWSETGMKHHPGIQPEDVQELARKGAGVVVLSRGMELQLQVDPTTLEWLRALGVAVHVAETTEAVRTYNELAATQAVGGLFHSTC